MCLIDTHFGSIIYYGTFFFNLKNVISMDSIRAIVVDDENASIYLLSSLISKHCPEIKIIKTANSVSSAIEQINLLKPDLVFLDINLQDGTGFDVLEQTNKNSYETVFVTAYEQYAVEAIAYSVLNYLLKPIVVEKLVECVSRYLRKNRDHDMKNIDGVFDFIKGDSNRLILPDTYGFKVVNINDVIRCEADGCYTHLYMKNKSEITVSKPMSNFNDILPHDSFCRVHSKHIVNLNFMKQYVKGRTGKIILENGDEVVVAERKKKDFFEQLKQLAHSLPDKKGLKN